MARHTLVLAALTALAVVLPAAASPPGIPAVTLLEPTGFVILDKPEDSIRFRWKVEMAVAKVLWPGKSFWAAPRIEVEGKAIEIKVKYRTPAVPESGIVEIETTYFEILGAGEKAGFDFRKACRISWRVDIRPKNEGGNLMTGQGSFTADVRGHSALSVSSDTWGDNGWPASFKVQNWQSWSSNPTTLRVTVKRLNEDQEIVRQHCPVRIADFEAPVPKVLYTPFVVAAKKPQITLAPSTKAKTAAGPALVKVAPGVGPGVGPGPTPTPPVVQQVVNCRFLVTALLPRADNPEDARMKPEGIRREFPINITVPLK